MQTIIRLNSSKIQMIERESKLFNQHIKLFTDKDLLIKTQLIKEIIRKLIKKIKFFNFKRLSAFESQKTKITTVISFKMTRMDMESWETFALIVTICMKQSITLTTMT